MMCQYKRYLTSRMLLGLTGEDNVLALSDGDAVSIDQTNSQNFCLELALAAQYQVRTEPSHDTTSQVQHEHHKNKID